MLMLTRWLSLMVLMVGGLVLPACRPEYPNCKKDAHCPGNKDKREWCVEGKCQQCRPGPLGKGDCPEGKECKAGRCEAIPGFCRRNDDCPGKLCENNRCVACKSDAQCQGGRCQAGRCVTGTRCTSNDDCKESEDCVNGFCVPAAARLGNQTYKASCNLDTVYFDFNEYVLSAEATSLIDRNAACIQREKKAVTLIGHTDPRGTEEYNLALSEKRAQAVKERLTRLGIPSQNLFTLPRGEIDASGNDETGWARDRRVEFQWR